MTDDLVASQKRRIAAGQPPVFEVEELPIEASFVVTDSKTGSGGFDLKVVKADAGLELSHETTQKVILRLKPVVATSRTRSGSEEKSEHEPGRRAGGIFPGAGE